jgi:DNA-binding response OmpR family regulator
MSAAGGPRYRLLVIEDDRDIADLLRMHVPDIDASVEVAADGVIGLARAQKEHWDAIVLDVRLPGLNGFDVCRELRGRGSLVPILMLTARAAELDRVLGLELGADDYLVKPFSILELQARIKALLRRVAFRSRQGGGDAAGSPAALEAGPLRLDRLQRRVWLATREVALTQREFDLLWFFAEHPGRVFSRLELLREVWGYGHEGYEHTVNSHINRLRAKLGDDPAGAALIFTVWGVGYRFQAPAART